MKSVKEYVIKKRHIKTGTSNEIEISKLTSRYPNFYSSYKITVQVEVIDLVLNNEFWPNGVAVRKFFQTKKSEEKRKAENFQKHRVSASET